MGSRMIFLLFSGCLGAARFDDVHNSLYATHFCALDEHKLAATLRQRTRSRDMIGVYSGAVLRRVGVSLLAGPFEGEG